MPHLEGIIKGTKEFFQKEVVQYPGRKGYAFGNGVRAIMGYVGYQYFDNDVLELICITYCAVKAVQFTKDMIRYLW